MIHSGLQMVEASYGNSYLFNLYYVFISRIYINFWVYVMFTEKN
jgi:hypothetical protein